MAYSIKEIYFTLQGEGAQTGRAAVFLRFSGCNLWSGREADRASAVCDFCDTDFVGVDGPGGGKFASAEELAEAVSQHWPAENPDPPFVVCTGGEPLLQIDQTLVDALRDKGFEIALETNGTLPLTATFDWVCCSPKAGAPLVLTSGDELKMVFPQPNVSPADFDKLQFEHFYLQPMDGPQQDENASLAVDYCKHHPPWKVSLQTHKILGIR